MGWLVIVAVPLALVGEFEIKGPSGTKRNGTKLKGVG
jgi:hypothetical protein